MRRASASGVLAAVVVVSAVASLWFGLAADRLRESPWATNTALVDASATTSAVDEVGAAVRSVFSYDYGNTDVTERSARQVLAGEAVEQYTALFGEVRRQAVEQQVVFTTTVRSIGVTELVGDRARLLVFVDQQTLRSAEGQHTSRAGQLEVRAERADGHWRITAIRVL
jgi:Mce-associated membrane protein